MEKKETVFRCKECGATDVVMLAWVEPNNFIRKEDDEYCKTLSYCDDEYPEAFFCRHCDEYTEAERVEENIDE